MHIHAQSKDDLKERRGATQEDWSARLVTISPQFRSPSRPKLTTGRGMLSGRLRLQPSGPARSSGRAETSGFHCRNAARTYLSGRLCLQPSGPAKSSGRAETFGFHGRNAARTLVLAAVRSCKVIRTCRNLWLSQSKCNPPVLQTRPDMQKPRVFTVEMQPGRIRWHPSGPAMSSGGAETSGFHGRNAAVQSCQVVPMCRNLEKNRGKVGRGTKKCLRSVHADLLKTPM